MGQFKNDAEEVSGLNLSSDLSFRELGKCLFIQSSFQFSEATVPCRCEV